MNNSVKWCIARFRIFQKNSRHGEIVICLDRHEMIPDDITRTKGIKLQSQYD